MDTLIEYTNEIKSKFNGCFFEAPVDNPKVSVIIPVYNTGIYLEKCLESIIKQTLKDIEIIISDDGSNDISPQIIKAFETLDKRIKVITQKNQGQGAARNRGLEIAQGEYVGFIDSDDWIDLDYYEKLYNTAKKYDSDIALADYIRTGNGKTKKRLNITQEKLYKSLDEKFDVCRQAKNPCPTNKIYRRELLDKENIIFPEGVYNEDKIFTCRAVYFANSVSTATNTYYYYYRRANSTVKTKDTKHNQDKLDAQKDVLKFLREKNVKLKNDDFWAIKKECKLFGIKWLTIKENLTTEKHLLFGFIPFKTVSLK